jgi:hypothetical protein
MKFYFTPISNFHIQNNRKQVRSLKSVGLFGMQSFAIKSGSANFVPILKLCFNFALNLAADFIYEYFLNLWKQAAIVPAFTNIGTCLYW